MFAGSHPSAMLLRGSRGQRSLVYDSSIVLCVKKIKIKKFQLTVGRVCCVIKGPCFKLFNLWERLMLWAVVIFIKKWVSVEFKNVARFIIIAQLRLNLQSWGKNMTVLLFEPNMAKVLIKIISINLSLFIYLEGRSRQPGCYDNLWQSWGTSVP